ncbi:MAG: DUF2520 domain-containing protein [Rhodocyclaceae bacterium]|nr:DUF2520 domain-containing protein [Rhodocyclaceae bacterium]
MPTLGLGFIGAGRVASTLSAAWSASGESIIGAYSRSFDSSTALLARCPPARAFVSAQELVSNCDLVFVTVPDSAIEEVVNEITWRAGQFVVHCSAAGELALLRHAQTCGAQVGGFHPLQIFSDPDVAREHLAGSSVAIEATGELHTQLYRLAAQLKMTPLTLRAGARLRYHLAGNFAASCMLALLAEAANLWEECGFERDTALPALMPLSLGTLDSARRLGLAKAVSGPVSRGDTATLARHLELVAQRTEGDVLYREILARLLDLAQASHRLSEKQIAALHSVIDQI